MIAKNAPMGWNSWDCYGAAVNESQVRANAKYLSENLLEYGWEYVVVDIQWYESKAKGHEYNHFIELEMDKYSRLIPDVIRFPSSKNGEGFRKLATDIHAMGLKFGIHIMRGIPRQSTYRNTEILNSDYTARDIAKFNSICNWNSDMYGLKNNDGAQKYYDSIFKLYADWGVDFVKVDDIANHYPRYEVEMIKKAISKCGRPMVLSLSPGAAKIEEAEHLKKNANMWRITDDFWDDWKLLYAMFERADIWSSHSGPGHWPDADMLPIGAIRQLETSDRWTKFTPHEQITMMNLWALIRSPLMIGCDLTYNDKFTLDLLRNKKLLELHKNSHGAHQVSRILINNTEIAIWIASNLCGDYYLAIFNIGEDDYQDTLRLSDFDLPSKGLISELWNEHSFISDEIAILLMKHQSVIYQIKKCS